ncbi:MAG: hypothetical protein K2W82_07945 [Candidatus Obscuribacterales bacterium]|nr:hypothetical protein [Candidatus Obscuribacterales bacterium]
MSSKKYLYNLFMAASLALAIPLAQAASPRQQVNTALNNAKSHTDTLVKNVASFLQMTGRWAPAPQGKDMQLCQALQSFQQQVNLTAKNNGSQSFNTMQFQLQQLQSQAQNLGQLINQVGPNPTVLSSWNQVQGDMMAINQAFYMPGGANTMNNFYDSEPGMISNFAGINPMMPTNPMNPMMPSNPMFPGNQMFPGNNQPLPTYSSYGNNFGNSNNQSMSSALNSAERSTNRLIKRVTSFLQMRGRWMPASGTPEFQLCQDLQNFQQALRQAQRTSFGMSYPVRQNQLQQLNAAAQNIDRDLIQASVTPDISNQWNSVRNDLNAVFQSFYTSNNGYMPR